MAPQASRAVAPAAAPSPPSPPMLKPPPQQKPHPRAQQTVPREPPAKDPHAAQLKGGPRRWTSGINEDMRSYKHPSKRAQPGGHRVEAEPRRGSSSTSLRGGSGGRWQGGGRRDARQRPARQSFQEALSLLDDGWVDDLGCNMQLSRMLKDCTWSQSFWLLAHAREVNAEVDTVVINTALSRCAKDPRSAWRHAVARLQGMQAPDLQSYGSVLSTCERADQWQTTLALLESMEEAVVTPDAQAYNSVLLALERAPPLLDRAKGLTAWQKAFEVVEAMQAAKVVPNEVTHSAVIAACQACGEEAQAAEFCKRMLRSLRLHVPEQALQAILLRAKLRFLQGSEEDVKITEMMLKAQANCAGKALEFQTPQTVAMFAWALAALGIAAGDAWRRTSKRARALAESLPWRSLGNLSLASIPSSSSSSSSPSSSSSAEDRFQDRRAASAAGSMPLPIDKWDAIVLGSLKAANWKVAALEAERQLLMLRAVQMCFQPRGAKMPKGALLVVDDEELDLKLQSLGVEVLGWHRLISADDPELLPPDLPPDGFDGGILRLTGMQSTRGGGGIRLPLTVACSSLKPNATLLVCGTDDDGIHCLKMPDSLGEMFSYVQEVAAIGRFRILELQRTNKPVAMTRAALTEVFREQVTLNLTELQMPRLQNWTVWPGLFAGGTLDLMTRFLLENLREAGIPPNQQVLDMCCGSGVIARVVQVIQPSAELHLADADVLALDAAFENIQGENVQFWHGNGWRAVPEDMRFDLVLCNPPLHLRDEWDFRIVRDIIMDAPAHLKPNGELWIVSQATVPLGPFFKAARLEVFDTPTERGRFMLWRARCKS